MKKALLSLCLLLFSGALNFSARAADAPAAPPAKKDPSIEERVADLEAYVSNGSRGSEAENAKITSKLDGTPGPGHNAWQVTSAALVLFMTLPGLPLFYGALLRPENTTPSPPPWPAITSFVTRSCGVGRRRCGVPD